MPYNRLLSYPETEALLDHFDIRIPPSIFVADKERVMEAAKSMVFPLVLKAVSPAMSHKSDRGLLRLDIPDEMSLRAALDAVCLSAHELPVEGYLLQSMLPKGIEVILGVTRDEQFGPVLAFGSGGTLVELMNDICFRLPPISDWEAEEMVKETKISKMLSGYRDLAAIDHKSLYRTIRNLSDMVVSLGDHLHSLDINPLILLPEGGFAVDARIYVNEEQYGIKTSSN